MPDDRADKNVLPPLAALGGWSDADWFSPTILTDFDVVGFSLPRIARVRKQSFHIVERSEIRRPSTAKAKAVASPPPKRLAGKLSQILSLYGATTAVACSRSGFIFESAPLLFFAELPLSRLKPRPAAKLRRDLVGVHMRGCFVHMTTTSATIMFWPFVEHEITAFINAATPDHPLHTDFDITPAKVNSLQPRSVSRLEAQASRRNIEREKKLLKEITELRKQIVTSRRTLSTVEAMEHLGLDDARLKLMLKLLHPDRHGGSEAANDAAKWLNNLREMLKGRTT